MAACSLQLIITVSFQKSVLAMLLTEYGGKLFLACLHFPTGSMRKVSPFDVTRYSIIEAPSVKALCVFLYIIPVVDYIVFHY